MLVQVLLILVSLLAVAAPEVPGVWVGLHEVGQQLGLVGEALGAAAAGVPELVRVSDHVLDHCILPVTSKSTIKAFKLSFTSMSICSMIVQALFGFIPFATKMTFVGHEVIH